MSSKLIRKTFCPQCRQEGRDDKGDNLAVYDDGHSFCFGGHGYSGSHDGNSGASKALDSRAYTLQYVGWRGVTKETMEAFGVKCKVDSDGVPHSFVFPYGDKAYKERLFKDKQFFSDGEMNVAPLFGMDRFSSGQSKSITVTEGELDALSAYQILGSKYPVVSVRNATTARGDCERHRAYLNSFERIYLAFDNDQPGQKAVREIAKLFEPSKVYHVKLSKFKDANEYLTNGAEKEFLSVWWNSKPYLPDGLVADYGSIAEILKSADAVAVADYPFPTLNAMTMGIRLGECNVILAPEKIGKTEFIRAIEYHLLKTTDYNMAIIHLEEKEKRSVLGLIGYELGVPAHRPDSGVSVEEQLKAYQALSKRDGRVHYYRHFGSQDPDTILDVIRYLVSVCHCKFVFLDHITMLVTGFEGDDERKKLDYISTRLTMLTRELDFTLFLISHVNDDGKPRGSRNITKVADLTIALDRDKLSEDPEIRNTMSLIVRDNRYGSITGPAGTLKFDPSTFKLQENKEAIVQGIPF